MKWLVLIGFLLIIASMASAMVFLVRDKGGTRNVARALTFRVGFSILLFAMLLFANWMGWISSTGLPVNRTG
ncbi:MAG: twin transmembrane helix small protein [Burkholderiaceae bacterium]